MANNPKQQGEHHHVRVAVPWFVRLWALVLLVTVLWASVMAFAFLFRSIFEPAVAPERFTETPVRFEVAALREAVETHDLAAMATGPMDHFHGLGNWTPPRVLSGCATSGCHDPLPHTENKGVRAFANMHAMFLDCRLCHDSSVGTPAAVQWVDHQTGQVRTQPPAIMRLIQTLNQAEENTGDKEAESDGSIVTMLKDVLAEGGENSQLRYHLVQLETTLPDSPVWRQTVVRLRRELPALVRGEYGASLAVVPSTLGDVPDNNEMVSLARRYLAMKPEADGYQKLFDSMHERIVEKPDACFACHSGEAERLDLAKLGYWPERVDELKRLPLARLVERVRSGEPFYLPKILETQDGE